MRTACALALLALSAAPAAAETRPAPPPPLVSPDKTLAVELLVGPFSGVGRKLSQLGPRTPGIAMQRLTIQPGAGVPPHVHEHTDETIQILQGGGVVTIDGKAERVGAGATVFIPMGKHHAFKADGPGPTVAIQVYDPAGPEARFLQWAKPTP